MSNSGQNGSAVSESNERAGLAGSEVAKPASGEELAEHSNQGLDNQSQSPEKLF